MSELNNLLNGMSGADGFAVAEDPGLAPLTAPPGQPAWTLAEAVELCKRAETLARTMNMHVALTGSVLYGGGTGKDLDILVWGHGGYVPTRIALRQLVRVVGAEPHPDNADAQRYAPLDSFRLIELTLVEGRRVDWIVANCKR